MSIIIFILIVLQYLMLGTEIAIIKYILIIITNTY